MARAAILPVARRTGDVDLAEARRELVASKHVKVQMTNGLATVIANVRENPISRVVNSMIPGHHRTNSEQVSENLWLVSTGVIQGIKMLVCYDKNVRFRLRLYVPESSDVFVLIDRIRRKLAMRDLAENAVVGHRFLLILVRSSRRQHSILYRSNMGA